MLTSFLGGCLAGVTVVKLTEYTCCQFYKYFQAFNFWLYDCINVCQRSLQYVSNHRIALLLSENKENIPVHDHDLENYSGPAAGGLVTGNISEEDDEEEGDDNNNPLISQNTDNQINLQDYAAANGTAAGANSRENQNLLNLLYTIAEDQARKEGYVHRGITCDECKQFPIRGIRYMCTNCTNYDLCEICETQGKHNSNHVFLKLRVPIPPLANPRNTMLPVFYPGSDENSEMLDDANLSRLIIETHFDKVELEALFIQFKSLAKWVNGKSFIDRETFIQCLGPLGTNNNLVTERIYSFYDQDQDGLINFEELAKGLSILCKGSQEEKIEYAFKGYDLDDSGYISREELRKMFKAYFYLSMDLVRDVVKALEEEMIANFDDEGDKPVSSYFNTPIPQDSSGYTAVEKGASSEVTNGLSEEEEEEEYIPSSDETKDNNSSGVLCDNNSKSALAENQIDGKKPQSRDTRNNSITMPSDKLENENVLVLTDVTNESKDCGERSDDCKSANAVRDITKDAPNNAATDEEDIEYIEDVKLFCRALNHITGTERIDSAENSNNFGVGKINIENVDSSLVSKSTSNLLANDETLAFSSAGSSNSKSCIRSNSVAGSSFSRSNSVAGSSFSRSNSTTSNFDIASFASSSNINKLNSEDGNNQSNSNLNGAEGLRKNTLLSESSMNMVQTLANGIKQRRHSISSSEFSIEVAKMMVEISENAIEEMVNNAFKSADVDHDGNLSYEEFKNWAANDSAMMAWFEALGGVF